MYQKRLDFKLDDPSKDKALLEADIKLIINHILEVQKHLSKLDTILEERKEAISNIDKSSTQVTLQSYSFSARVTNCLALNDITTSAQLRSLTKLDFFKMRGIGKASIDEIVGTLTDFHADYKLKDR